MPPNTTVKQLRQSLSLDSDPKSPDRVKGSPPHNANSPNKLRASNSLDPDIHSPERVSQGSQLSSKISASLRRTLENSAHKQGGTAAQKMQEMLNKQQQNKKGGSVVASETGSRQGGS